MDIMNECLFVFEHLRPFGDDRGKESLSMFFTEFPYYRFINKLSKLERCNQKNKNRQTQSAIILLIKEACIFFNEKTIS